MVLSSSRRDEVGLSIYRVSKGSKYNELLDSTCLIVCPACSAVGTAQAGLILQFLVCGNPAVRQLIPAVSVEVCVFRCLMYAQCFFQDKLHGPVPLLSGPSFQPNWLWLLETKDIVNAFFYQSESIMFGLTVLSMLPPFPLFRSSCCFSPALVKFRKPCLSYGWDCHTQSSTHSPLLC